jgi:hypothetical protein
MSKPNYSQVASFTNKSHLKKLSDGGQTLSQSPYYVEDNPRTFCECYQNKVNFAIQGYTDASQSIYMRVSQLVTLPLGGKVVFGDFGKPYQLTYLGGIEGQSGGSPAPPRNKF